MEEVSLARQAAVVEILREAGVDGIVALAGRVQLSFEVGIAIAKTMPCGAAEDEFLDRTLANTDLQINQTGVCFVWQRYQLKGSGWSDRTLDSELFKGWPSAKQAAFCLGLPDGQSTWRIVAGLGAAVESKYWEQVRIFLVRLAGNEDCEFAAGKLMEAGRALEALDQAGSHPEKLSTGLLVQILDAAIQELAKLNKLHVGTLDHDIQRILIRLRASGELSQNELARLEWQYLPLLRPFHRPVTLYKALQTDPELFADLVTHAFRADEGTETLPVVEPDQSDETARNRARLAWDLLSRWDSVPGTGQDGKLDANELKDWFARARAVCAAKGRSRIGDIQIGRMLAHAAPDADGIWPPGPVRDLIEDAESRNLESGLHSGRINQRGVFTKSPSDGGRPERELAKRYRNGAKAVNAQWQRTARLLIALAETYESFGRNDDISAERMGFI
jgi:hypothetical protein